MAKQKFVYIGPNRIDKEGNEHPVNTYCGMNVMTGETIELEGHFAEKANKHPYYERVKPGPKPGFKLAVNAAENDAL